jgi:hypothetical protein
MKLKNAAKFFDTCQVYDGYSGASLFKVQTSTFLESSPAGSTSARRAISLAPTLVPPSHSCILVLDQLWLLGAENPDEWAGSAIRRAYWTRKVTDQFRILTPSQALLNSAGTLAYGARQFLRESINTQTDSELDPVWDIAFSSSLKPGRGTFLKSASSLYRVRMLYEDLDGFTTCQSDEVDEPVRTLTFKSSNAYDPVQDTYSEITVNAKVILLDYQKAFSKREVVEHKVQAGDLIAVVSPQQVIPMVGQRVRIETASRYAGEWNVLKVSSELDAKYLHIRSV